MAVFCSLLPRSLKLPFPALFCQQSISHSRVMAVLEQCQSRALIPLGTGGQAQGGPGPSILPAES